MKNTQLLSPLCVFMVDPIGFGFNEETASSNAFQNTASHFPPHELELIVRREFHDFVNTLVKNGIHVETLPGRKGLPDAVFPNNLFSTMNDGTWIDYPMMANNRQKERELGVGDYLITKGFQIQKRIDLTYWEKENRFLEGTGSIILHKPSQQAWIANSPRADRAVAESWSEATGYAFHFFNTRDKQLQPVYHTNVLLSIGSHWHFICSEMILESEPIAESLETISSCSIDLTMEQVYHFSGNVLEVQNGQHQPFGIISSTGWNALSGKQKRAWEQFVQPLIVDIPMIEKIGGGSARCMMAEIYLPYK
jgi:hypothetical protein